MTNLQIISRALQEALAGAEITDTATLRAALHEQAAETDFHQIGVAAVRAMLDFFHSDLEAQRQILLSQIAAAKGGR